MVLGRWSGKCQEPISPFRQELHWQNLSDVTTWKSGVYWKLATSRGRTGQWVAVHFSQFSALGIVAATHPHPRSLVDSCAGVPGGKLHSASRSQVGVKGPCPLNVRGLSVTAVSDHRHAKRQPCSCLCPCPDHLTWLPEDLKYQHPVFPSFIFLCCLFWRQTLNTRTFKRTQGVNPH